MEEQARAEADVQTLCKLLGSALPLPAFQVKVRSRVGAGSRERAQGPCGSGISKEGDRVMVIKYIKAKKAQPLGLHSEAAAFIQPPRGARILLFTFPLTKFRVRVQDDALAAEALPQFQKGEKTYIIFHSPARIQSSLVMMHCNFISNKIPRCRLIDMHIALFCQHQWDSRCTAPVGNQSHIFTCKSNGGVKPQRHKIITR